MGRVRSLTIVAVMTAMLFGSVAAAYPQRSDPNCRYFVETGHYVCDEFLAFYDTWGGVEIFGYPLTERFEDPERWRGVQYFQRARMEWHPENPNPYKVQLGLLVDELGYNYPPAQENQIPTFNSSHHHYFPEVGHVVSYAFLDYFREKGGVYIFGYPRSEFMYENGYIVQYFQRARMEWHPEVISGPQMRLTNIGETYIERFGVPEGCDDPLSGPDAPGEAASESAVTTLYTSASVRYVITGRQGVQTVFVYVNNQQQQPVEGAAVKMTVHYQSGDQRYEFEPTNVSGFTQRCFNILPAPPGQKIVIDVTVTYGNVTATTQTFFLPWW